MSWLRESQSAGRSVGGDESSSGSRSSKSLRYHLGLYFPLQIHYLIVWSTLVLALDSQPVHQASPLHDRDDQHWLAHPRAPELCAHSFNGYEGTPIKGFALDRAFVVTTPGLVFRQRTDSLLTHGGHATTHCHFHKYAKWHPSDKIKSFPEALWQKHNVHFKTKQGADFKQFNHVPQSIRCKDDMLTPEGITQAVHLGEYLAKSYLKTIRSLSPSLSTANDVAYTAGDERLYQSIHAVLFGLLTEKQFVHAHVEKLSYHFTDDSKSRVEVQDDLSGYVKGSFKNEHHLFKDHSSPTVNRWSIDSEFGRDISAKDILTSLSLKECDKRVEGAAHLSDDLIESVLSVSDSHNEYLFNSSLFFNYSKSTTLPFRKFLNTWISSLQNANDFKLVSVDELFMLSLLTMLGSDEIKHIPPVSRLVIERFHLQHRSLSKLDVSLSSSSSHSLPTSVVTKKPSHGKGEEKSIHKSKHDGLDLRDVYFRILYNGKVITQSISNCRSDPVVSLGLCRMPNFIKALMSDDLAQFKDEL